MVLMASSKENVISFMIEIRSQQFLSMLGEVGIESVKLPPRAPNLKEYAERFVRTVKEGCLDQMIFFCEDSLRQAIHEFVRATATAWRAAITITGRRHKSPTLGHWSH